MALFTLQPRTWYAMEYTFSDGYRHYSPIFCYDVRARKTGQGRLDLFFWHGAYADGVNDKGYTLRVLHRDRGYLVALRKHGEGSAALLLTDLKEEWMKLHFRFEVEGKPSELSLPDWLNRRYPGVSQNVPPMPHWSD